MGARLLSWLGYLPFWVLYGISDVSCFVLQYIVRYRRRMVRQNLRAAFPGHTDRQLDAIRRRFYRNFTDVFVETLKLSHISDAEMCRRMCWQGLDVAQRLLDQGRSVVVYFSHCGNWEWAPSVTLHLHPANPDKMVFGQVYRPLRSASMDAFMLRLRSRFGSVSFPKNAVLRRLLMLRRDAVQSMTGFMSDQKPSHNDTPLTVEFLHQPTRFITGTETLARKLGMAVIYWDMQRLRRGHYCITMRHMADNAADTAEGQLTQQYAQMLQQTILRDPSAWLWSHNRWQRPRH